MLRERDACIGRRIAPPARANAGQGGKPFACIAVDQASGEVVHEAMNQVSQTGDVSAHAEINAIRELAAAGRGQP